MIAKRHELGVLGQTAHIKHVAKPGFRLGQAILQRAVLVTAGTVFVEHLIGGFFGRRGIHGKGRGPGLILGPGGRGQ